MATSGGYQNALGARWIGPVLRALPERRRQAFALWILALSPHYFFTSDHAAEAQRNRDSRAKLTDDLLRPYLSAGMRVIDYGCGPGYMAAAVANYVDTVEAVDVSRGVLACASVLNGDPKIIYETPAQCGARAEEVDVAYSFAVAQHLTDDTLADVLCMLHRRLRPGGQLLMHFSLVVDGFPTEEEWRSGTSALARTRARWGMSCFGRSSGGMEKLLANAGFDEVVIEPLAGKTDAETDIPQQHWAICRRG